MSLVGWSWNLMNVMALPLLFGAGVDYSIHIQLALRRHAGDVTRVRRSVGRAILLCGCSTAAGFGTLAWAIGLITVFSFNIWEEVYPLGQFETFATTNPYGLIDYFTANLMMPLGGILMALFVGWLVKPSVLAEDLSVGNALLAKTWLWMIRVVVPLAIFWILYTSL